MDAPAAELTDAEPGKLIVAARANLGGVLATVCPSASS